MGTAALGQGTTGRADAGHEQGGFLLLGLKARPGHGRHGSGSGRQCWWRTARDLGSGSAHGKEWRQGTTMKLGG